MLVSSTAILERRERRQYQLAINTAIIKMGMAIPIPMPILLPVLRPALGAEVCVFVGEDVGDVEVEEVEVDEVEEDAVMLK